MSAENLRARLEAFIQAQTGTPAAVESLTPLTGGASRESWVVALRLGDQAERLVLRRDPPTATYERALTRDQEFALVQAAHRSGVLAPRPRWHSGGSDALDSPFFLVDFVEGVSAGRQIVRAPELAAARAALPQQMAEQLARIHAVDVSAHALDFLPGPRAGLSPAQEALAQVRELLDALADTLDTHSPALEFGLRWAEQHLPPAGALTLVHGDFRLGNLIVGPQGLHAVVDWEFGHLGDPLEELGYLCMRDWRFGMGHLRLSGLCAREPFLAAYERYSGAPVDRAAVDWWEIMGNLRWGAVCLAQANRHLSGVDRSVEYASLGRRSAEMQLELLRLIEDAL
jgi:aminoglycoside phosphotransferase (APT) family kinase protein